MSELVRPKRNRSEPRSLATRGAAAPAAPELPSWRDLWEDLRSTRSLLEQREERLNAARDAFEAGGEKPEVRAVRAVKVLGFSKRKYPDAPGLLMAYFVLRLGYLEDPKRDARALVVDLRRHPVHGLMDWPPLVDAPHTPLDRPPWVNWVKSQPLSAAAGLEALRVACGAKTPDAVRAALDEARRELRRRLDNKARDPLLQELPLVQECFERLLEVWEILSPPARSNRSR